MYNIEFVVRYHDIEVELIKKLERKAQEKKEKDATEIIAQALALAQAQAQSEQKINEEANTKKKGRKKKTLEPETVPIVTSDTPVEPKKRGRKKVIKEPIKEEIKREEIKKEEPKKDEDDEDEDIEYTMEDVYIICEKLYRDELLSVFKVHNGTIDTDIKNVIEQMVDNKAFKQLLDDIKHEVIDENHFTGTPTEIDNIKRNSEYLIFVTLFSQPIFHITHKCICQLFTVGEIDPELILRLKEKTISLFKK